MKKPLILLAFLLTFFRFDTIAQYGFSAGPTFLKPFGVSKLFTGFHIMGEYNEDDLSSLYARFSFLPSVSSTVGSSVISAKDPNTIPYTKEISSKEKMNYSVLEFGKRYYFGEGYESGFGVYGGTNLSIVFNKVRNELEDYDKSLYTASVDDSQTASIIGLAFGLNGGVKNSFYFGTIYFDAGINYSIYAVPSKNLSAWPENYSQLFFAFNIGFRKNIY